MDRVNKIDNFKSKFKSQKIKQIDININFKPNNNKIFILKNKFEK